MTSRIILYTELTLFPYILVVVMLAILGIYIPVSVDVFHASILATLAIGFFVAYLIDRKYMEMKE